VKEKDRKKKVTTRSLLGNKFVFLLFISIIYQTTFLPEYSLADGAAGKTSLFARYASCSCWSARGH
jgi:hypothetical protein